MFKKNCPECNKEQIYKYKETWKTAVKKNSKCNTCCRLGELHPNYSGRTEPKDCIDCGTKIDFRSTRCRSCKQKAQIKENGLIPAFVNSSRNTGKKHTKETLKQMSKSAIKRGANFNAVNYNKSSIPIIEKFGKDNGYNFQHAENGGEYKVRLDSGREYWVDGYDKENNVVVEFIENSNWHNSPSKKIYHKLRKQEIKDKLGCKYYELHG
jgi:hypothetical protein